MTALAPLELAMSFVLGRDGPRELPEAPSTPVDALEAAVLPALRHPPCLVSFSGGRDSSAVLAVATAVARREGLAEPIPATIRAPGAGAAQESGWQELVVAHLGLRDWIRVEVDDELDVVGPVARRGLARHGLLWPFNVHFHVPLLEAAAGGSLLTGIGGDELFAAATSRRAAAVLTGRVRPRPRDIRRVALHAAPRRVRRRWRLRTAGVAYPWLTPEATAAVRAALADAEAAEPRRMEARVRHVRAARYLRVGTGALELLARDAGASVTHPLLDRTTWSAVARHAPRGGHLGRADAMRATFGHLLPAEVLDRPDKACFDEVLFHRHSRELAAAWQGAGAPAAIVDADALRAHWLSPGPRAQSFTLLQAAWLASAADGGDQAGAGLRERIPAARTAQAQDGQ